MHPAKDSLLILTHTARLHSGSQEWWIDLFSDFFSSKQKKLSNPIQPNLKIDGLEETYPVLIRKKKND